MLKVVPSWSKLGQKVPLEGSQEEETMVLKLIPPTQAGQEAQDADRVNMDLVFVLDISLSMKGDRLKKMKQTMEMVIDQWTRKMDHLCIISFSTHAKVEFGRSRMRDQATKAKAKEAVRSLAANGSTNMQGGLQLALKEVEKADRVNHAAAIVLMSDGAENHGSNARGVAVQHIPIDTIGFGTEHDHKVLHDVASLSDGGVFMNSWEFKKLGSVLSPILDHWKHISLKDLELTVERKDPRMRLQVTYGSYPNKDGTPPGGAVITKKVPHLSDHPNWVTVSFKLPAAEKEGKQTLMTVSWKYKRVPGGSTVMNNPSNPPIEVFVLRTRGPPHRPRSLVIPKQVKTEQIRLRHAAMIKEVRDLADAGRYDQADEKLSVGMEVLDEALGMPDSDVSRGAIDHLYAEVEELLKATESEDKYKKHGGQVFVVASISSHDRQRYVSRGHDNCRIRLFASPRLSKYLDEAVHFDRMSCAA